MHWSPNFFSLLARIRLSSNPFFEEILDELVLVFRYLHFTDDEPAPKANIEVDLDMDTDVVVEADPRQIRQVFWNLLNNAVQAMPEGGAITTRWT